MRRVAEETRVYEGMFLVKNKPAKDDFDGVLKELSSYVEEIGATIINCGKWDERRLAYDIKGERRGTYVLFHFEAEPESIARLERRCRISDLVMRALIVRDTDGTKLPPPGSGLISSAPAEGAPEARGEGEETGKSKPEENPEGGKGPEGEKDG